MWKFFFEGPGDKIANYLGLVLTLIGFWITISVVRKARKATEDVKKEIKNISTITDLSTAIATMEEIKRIHRDGDPKILLDRYSSLKKLLISIKYSYPNLTEEQKTNLQSTIVQISNSENAIEKSLFSQDETLDIPKRNRILSTSIEKTYEMLINCKIGTGE